MTNGRAQNGRIGDLGVALTIYRLRKVGIFAEEAGGGGQPFDVSALYDGRLWRVQVKTTRSIKRNRATFLTARGRYANKTSHHKALSQYTTDHADILALAVLDLERVFFMPVIDIPLRTRVPATKFAADPELNSFIDAVKRLYLEYED